MRLKRLELKGFKSFAEETVIHFSEDVTGIVGPNGSGKSNIVDAVRWVLGEQSSKDLRLESMSDIIFNGTKKRRKSPFAKVVIVFDNDKGILPSEYSEVEIKRTLDHDGHSEYYLNGVKCRLKDIKGLLVDTGIGSNSYAIIALGMVDDILNDTDNARRRMFEQAAGISKYKQRKHQSMLKLKSTNADLERIEDLLHEINKNLKSLKRQARRAKKYLQVKQDYMDCSIKLAALKSQELNEQYKSVQASIKSEKDKALQVQTEINKVELEVEERKNRNTEKEIEVGSAQKGLTELVNSIRTLDNERNIAEQKITFAERQITDLNEREKRTITRKKSSNQEIEQYESQIKAEKEKLKGLQEHKVELKKVKDEIEERLSRVGADRSEQLQFQQKIEREQLQHEKEISVLESRIEDIKNRDTSNKNKIDSLENSLETLENSHAEEIRSIDELEKKLTGLNTVEDARIEKLSETEENIQSLRDELREINRKMDAWQNEYKLIKNLVDKLEGFPESIKFLNKQEDWGGNARLFSDILYCEEQYRSAIENYLEPYLSYYVVATTGKAFEAITLLKGAQKGKAQFFINSAFDQPEQMPEKLPGLLPAVDIVEVDPQYEQLMSSLLSEVYIVEKGRDFDALAAQFPSKILLAYDGTVVKWKNRISGGSTGLFEGKRIGRKKHLEKLKEKINNLRVQQSDKDKKLNQFLNQKEKLMAQDVSGEIKSLNKTLEQEYRKSQQSAIKIENIKENIAGLKLSNTQSGKQNESYIAERDNHVKVLEKIVKTLKEVSEDMQNIEGAYSDVNKKASALSERYNQQNIQVIRQENLIERRNQDLANSQRILNEAINELSQINTERESRNQEKLRNTEHIQELRKQLEVKSELKKEKESNLTEVETVYYKEKEEIRNLEDGLKNNQKKLRQYEYLVAEYKDKYNDLKLDLNRMAERLKVEFDVSMDAILNTELEEELDVEILSEKVEKLRGKKERFGEVNPMALEAYEEMNERYELMVQQKDDIEKARESLEETIQEIEMRATERFMGAFEKIRGYFKEVFRTLFRSEDSCDLILEDESDPLESDIYIVARPKGKKPKSISQLSGGEKTLTATALLFALYLLKPAPFCIFDEVDAPLDDANIDKFNNIIKEFSKHSQFVIVTHNKMTMASVDVIYGVYMDDPGVSGVSAVDFRHYEDSGLAMSEE